MARVDGHIHIERGDYSLEWIQQFVDKAVETQMDEIRLLEHCYIFEEFRPMYHSVCAHSKFVDEWFQRKAGKHKLPEYLELIEKITKNKGFDFLLGSVHFVDDFAFDHKPEHWIGIDVDAIYRTYFEDSILLAKSKLFDGIGHPDAIKLFGHRPSFSLSGYYERLAKELSNSNMYADQNSGAARRCPGTSSLGMERELLRAMKKNHVKIITSSDAHCPEDVGDKIRDLENCVVNA